jgi:hypothetical protein
MTTRSKVLTHLPDASRWTENQPGFPRVFHPDKFQLFDGDGNIGTDIWNLKYEIKEVTENGKVLVWLVVDHDTHNHSWSHDATDSTYVTIHGEHGDEIVPSLISWRPDRGDCSKRHTHEEISFGAVWSGLGIYDRAFGIKIYPQQITGPIGPC